VVLMRSEVTAAVLEDRLRPRIRDTARVLWTIYASLFVANAIALALAGLPAFDAVCHALTTVSTGGFSTSDLSFAGFSPAAQWICIAFMFLGATSFLLHGKAVSGDLLAYAKSEEFRAYVLILLVSTLLVTAVVMATAGPVVESPVPSLAPETHDEAAFGTALRDAAFQVTSIMTSTGFASADYDAWPDAARFLLIVLMLVGSCSGSTAGGLKVFRVLLVIRTIGRQLRLLLSPARVVNVRYGDATVPRDTLLAASTLMLLALFLVVLGALALTLMGLGLAESLSGAISCLTCVGPAFGELGPTGNYADVPALGKVVLSALMLMGRLEVYAVLVLFAMIGRK
ncbi:MAG: TrkH family potassium uptake protein, partial [Planctomycetota bacterium JB042]